MVCRSCGYDNPREHRYCGMCGTPFPHRPLTVPAAQSTLAFTATPLEVGSSPQTIHAVESAAPAATEVVVQTSATHSGPIEPGPFVAELVESLPVVDVSPVVETVGIAPTIASVEPEAVFPSAEPRIIEEAPVIEATSPIPAELEPAVELSAPLATQAAEEAVSVAEEPVHEVPYAAEAAVAEDSVEPLPAVPAPPITAPLPTPTVAIPPTRPAPLREEVPSYEISKPPAPPRQPYIAARSVAPPRPAPPAPVDVAPSRVAAIHPSPDSLPITSPPESAGMPTFQSVVDAAGAPPISPFEPPAKKDIDEDEELKEFVANFFYKPPDETVDELTMRSEVPVIDKEEPAQFHHPSFDDDVAPPPEAGAHAAAEARFPSAANDMNRPRFLDITEHPRSALSDQPPAVGSGSSFLHLDESAHVGAEALPPAKSHWLMWSSLVALLLIFGGLGFLEGRAAMTQEFRGPIEIAREQYDKLRQRISQMTASAPAPAVNPSDPGKQPPSQSETATTNQTPASSNPQSDSTSQSAASAPPTTAPTTTAQTQAQNQPSHQEPNQQSQPAIDTGPAPNSTEVANAEPTKPLDAPAPKPSNRPQPGQTELVKAMDASDPAAEAAWLWKATSRGNPEAPVRLADMYIKGKGVPHSCEQALVLLRSAAVKPNAAARNRLAALYANGTCVARDRVRAYALLSEALQADPTSEWADQSRKELWSHMTAAERFEAQRVH